ncbi:tetratricopeptide repeat protein [Calditrichota bacterium GD2]
MRWIIVFMLSILLSACAVFKPPEKATPKIATPAAPLKIQSAIDSLINEGINHHASGNDTLAIACWLKVMNYTDTIPDVFNYLGVAYQKLGQFERALEYFKKAVQLDSAYYEAFNNAGYMLLYLNQFDEAKKYFEKALSLNPQFERAKDNLKLVEKILAGKLTWQVFSLAESIQKKSDYLEEIEGYQKVLQMDSSYAKAHNNLGVIYYYEGKTDSAFKHIRLALYYNPDYPEAINNLGYLHKEAGNYDLALRLFFKALTLKPRYIGALNNLGETYYLKGELQNARRVFETVLDLEKNNRVAKKWLQKLDSL